METIETTSIHKLPFELQAASYTQISNSSTSHSMFSISINQHHCPATESKENEDNMDCNSLKPVKILVAEDNDSNYLLVRSILKNHELTRAINGKEAVELMLNHDFDIVLMDIRMPVMDGLEATIQIRKFNRDIKIVALTANVSDSDKERALEAGCNEFLTKPIIRSTLIGLVETTGREKKKQQ